MKTNETTVEAPPRCEAEALSRAAGGPAWDWDAIYADIAERYAPEVAAIVALSEDEISQRGKEIAEAVLADVKGWDLTDTHIAQFMDNEDLEVIPWAYVYFVNEALRAMLRNPGPVTCRLLLALGGPDKDGDIGTTPMGFFSKIFDNGGHPVSNYIFDAVMEDYKPLYE